MACSNIFILGVFTRGFMGYGVERLPSKCPAPPDTPMACSNLVKYAGGNFHIHDLNLLSVSCVGWGLADLLRQGFKGIAGNVESAPPRHLRTALGQRVNFLSARCKGPHRGLLVQSFFQHRPCGHERGLPQPHAPRYRLGNGAGLCHTQYKLPYFTITPTFSICADHGYLRGEQLKCPVCDAATEVYSRVVGYLRPVNRWNDGKQAEYAGRTPYEPAITR